MKKKEKREKSRRVPTKLVVMVVFDLGRVQEKGASYSIPADIFFPLVPQTGITPVPPAAEAQS